MLLLKRTLCVLSRLWSYSATIVPALRSPALETNWPVWVVAGVAFLNGLIEVLYVVVSLRYQLGISGMLPFGLHYWNRDLSLVFGIALLYLSLNLFRRSGWRGGSRWQAPPWWRWTTRYWASRGIRLSHRRRRWGFFSFSTTGSRCTANPGASCGVSESSWPASSWSSRTGLLASGC